MPSMALDCNQVMFGSMLSCANHLNITAQGIQLSNLCQNTVNYSVLIAFNHIIDLKYCKHYSVSGICLKPDKQSNDEITKQSFLQNQSINGFKFDINSSDISDHYITAVLKDELTQEVVSYLQNLCTDYSDLSLYEMSAEEFKTSLKEIIKRISNTLVMTSNQLAVDSTTDSMATTDGSLQQNETKIQNNNCPKNESNINESAITSSTEPILEFECKPIDIMFGTFELFANQLLFTLDYMRFDDISKNSINSKLKQHFIIPFNFINQIIYNLQNSMTSLIINITHPFSLSVHQFLKIGKNESNRVFDVNSSDFRENYLILRFYSNCSQIFLKFLNDIRNRNKNISLEERDDRVTAIMFESTKTQSQLISNEIRVKDMENEIKLLRNECKGLKRKCNELEGNDVFCGICLEKKSNILAKELKMVSTICGHVFCKECLNNALKVRNVCPICVRSFQRPRKIPNFPVFHEIHI